MKMRTFKKMASASTSINALNKKKLTLVRLKAKSRWLNKGIVFYSIGYIKL